MCAKSRQPNSVKQKDSNSRKVPQITETDSNSRKVSQITEKDSHSRKIARIVEKDTDKQLKKLGERIKELRIAKGYSSYEIFAYEHNISRAQFGRYENGQDLRFSTLIRILQALDTSFADFFKDFDTK